MPDDTLAEAHLVVAARKLDSAEQCVKHRARTTAIEYLDQVDKATRAARAALEAP